MFDDESILSMLMQPSFRTEFRQYTFRIFHGPSTCMAMAVAMHCVILTVSLHFDWDWWPGAHGAGDGSYLQLIEKYSMTFISLLYLVYLVRWASPTTFRAVTFISLLLLFSVSAFAIFHYRVSNMDAHPGNHWISGCVPCSNRQWQLHNTGIANGTTANAADHVYHNRTDRTLVESISFVYPKTIRRGSMVNQGPRLHGLVLHPRRFKSGGQGPRFTEGVEEWLLSILTNQLRENWKIAMGSLLLTGASPLPPLPSLLIVAIFTTFALYPTLIELHWGATSVSSRGCCALTRVLPFLVGPYVVLVVTIRVFIEYSLAKSFLIWSLRKEMVSREKERLDFEARIANHSAERNRHGAERYKAILQAVLSLKTQPSFQVVQLQGVGEDDQLGTVSADEGKVALAALRTPSMNL